VSNNDVFATALNLLTLGFSVIPSGGGNTGKAPLVTWTAFQKRRPTEDELRQWQRELQPKLWGIVTGEISGMCAGDADNDQAKKVFEASDLYPHVGTPRGGGHYYFRYPGHHVKTIAGILPGIDIRGDGGFVNVVGR